MNRYVKLFLPVVIFCFCSGIHAQEIKIGLFYGKPVEAFVFSTIEGAYMLYGDSQPVITLKPGVMLHIERIGTMLKVQDTSRLYGSFHTLYFKSEAPEYIFQVKPVFPSLQPRESEGNLSASAVTGSILIINSLELELYIPGTIEAEGGSLAKPEYYKAQAIIARTYALKNFHRHAGEGFHLCDGVHCQSFNGKSRMNKEIYLATAQTRGLILADKLGMPVSAVYHSNCGGRTASASMVWNSWVNFLTPVNDPFCNKSANQNWTKELTLEAWKNYLSAKGLPVQDQASLCLTGSDRQQFFNPAKKMLPLTVIREDLNLKSAFFQVEISGNTAIIHGHGFGHGLGLCQQGAMEMAKVGYTYVDILMFYYRGLQIKKIDP
jgi:stage II sporulation protein D